MLHSDIRTATSPLLVAAGVLSCLAVLASMPVAGPGLLAVLGAAARRGGAAGEVAARRREYWQPYHDALRRLVDAARARHGHAVLLDAHSIRSQVPRLFPGWLPDINLGTNDGRSCDPRLAAALTALLAAQTTFSHVLDGRFKGGYITRHYGDPGRGVHALQIELAQAAYMDEAGTDFDAERAAPLVRLLSGIVASLLAFRPD